MKKVGNSIQISLIPIFLVSLQRISSSDYSDLILLELLTINPFKLYGNFHSYQMDQSISGFEGSLDGVVILFKFQ